MFERLTERTSDGIAYTKIPLNESHLNKRGVIEQCFTGLVADRLAAYEDSGLSPEEVQKLEKSDASKEQCIIDQHGEIHRLRDELKRYKQAEQEGRLVVLYDINPSSEQAIERIAGLTHETAEKALGGAE